jgi:hypothetical protein
VLGEFLLVGEQFAASALVLLVGAAARPGAGDGPHRDGAVLDAHQHFGRGADERDAVQLEEEQVRRRIERAQRAVEIEWRR